jgi:hypothetical protein
MEYPNVIALRNKVAEKLTAENIYCFWHVSLLLLVYYH